MCAGMSARRPSITIIGAGIIGLSCAWELSKRGAIVSVCERHWPPRGASWAAAGMLAPAYEAAAEEDVHPRLFDLCLASARLWPEFAESLEAESGINVGYSSGPTLVVASDKNALERAALLNTALKQKKLSSALWREEGLKGFAPELSERLLGGALLDHEGQVDNRRVIEALMKIVLGLGIEVVPEVKRADVTLVCKGWQSAQVRPVKGTLLSLEAVPGAPQYVIREGARYIVPKRDRIVIGATEEPGRSDDDVDQTAIDDLHQWAISTIPALSKASILETWSGIRPGTLDHAPILGRHEDQYLATGHYRNGILLAPITAKLMADMILDNEVSELTASFSPQRFETVST